MPNHNHSRGNSSNYNENNNDDDDNHHKTFIVAATTKFSKSHSLINYLSRSPLPPYRRDLTAERSGEGVRYLLA